MNQFSLFADAPSSVDRKPVEPIVRAALIDGNYRRWLKRRWGAGPTIFWAMLNPSDASAQRDDPTLWAIMGFSFRWGFGGLTVGNIYPFISSTPVAMKRWRASTDRDESAREAYVRNHYDCGALCREAEFHMAAWGAGADDADVRLWLDHLNSSDDGEVEHPINWHCLGTTVSGAPKHPLARGLHRIPVDQKPISWRRP